MKSIHSILQQYWGFQQFRPLQQDIIESVLAGKDTLALLPTGGGKSICFQVPALALDGVCIVVSPLIALMKDQVMNLNKRGIKSVAIYSGMSLRDIDTALDNCVFGHYKFLYVSPERLQTDDFKARMQLMNVGLIAVDEAHCISQWGYDFRPPYIHIAYVRPLAPSVPIIALTATATPKVVEDIQQKLAFKQKNVFSKSFLRKNLSYVVRHTTAKEDALVNVLQKVPGTAVVYVRNRRKTVEIARLLQQNKISAGFYHAGLTANERNVTQEQWINNQLRVVCCTNAFGMGIDKPDVRCVVHMEPPDSIEAYFQEAGRGGRDEKKAYAVLLCANHDAESLKKAVSERFPETEVIRNVYDKLCSHYKISYHEGIGESFDFDLHDFCETQQLKTTVVHNVLAQLQQSEIIVMNESFSSPSKLQMICSKDALFQFQKEKPALEPIIKFILRTCGGVFESLVPIEEEPMAKRLNIGLKECILQLQQLHKFKIVEYIPRKDTPQITMLHHRYAKEQLPLNFQKMQERKQNAIDKTEAIINYIETDSICRSVQLVRYFGEQNATECGICDVCLSRKKSTITEVELGHITAKISELLQQKPYSHAGLISTLTFRKELINDTIDFLTDIGRIAKNEDGLLIWLE